MANGCYARRITGPIVLITVGVLFLLDKLIPGGGWNFSRTWPILLIVIGAVKIFERFFVAPSSTAPPPSTGTGTPNTAWQAPPPSPGHSTPTGGTTNATGGNQEPPKS